MAYNPYKVLHNAKMTIYRHEEEKDGFISKKKALRLVAEDISCRYSAGSQVSLAGDISKIEVEHRLFCSSDVDIKEGDYVEISFTRLGVYNDETCIKGYIGECIPYRYEWQCNFKRSEYVK